MTTRKNSLVMEHGMHIKILAVQVYIQLFLKNRP